MILGFFNLVQDELVVSRKEFEGLLELTLSLKNAAREQDSFRGFVFFKDLCISIVEFEKCLHGVHCAKIVLIHVLCTC